MADKNHTHHENKMGQKLPALRQANTVPSTHGIWADRQPSLHLGDYQGYSHCILRQAARTLTSLLTWAQAPLYKSPWGGNQAGISQASKVDTRDMSMWPHLLP